MSDHLAVSAPFVNEFEVGAQPTLWTAVVVLVGGHDMPRAPGSLSKTPVPLRVRCGAVRHSLSLTVVDKLSHDKMWHVHKYVSNLQNVPHARTYLVVQPELASCCRTKDRLGWQSPQSRTWHDDAIWLQHQKTPPKAKVSFCGVYRLSRTQGCTKRWNVSVKSQGCLQRVAGYTKGPNKL